MSKRKSCGLKSISAIALALGIVPVSKAVYAQASEPAGTTAPYISIYETRYSNSTADNEHAKIHRALARKLANAEPGETVKTWVFFRDKGIASTGDYAASISDVASKYNRRAIDRRTRRRTLPGLFDEHDLPVVSSYIEQVKATGARMHVVSKWLNAVSVYATRDQIDRINALDFVKQMQPVRHSRRINSRTSSEPQGPIEETLRQDPAQGGDTCGSAIVITGVPFSDTGSTLGYVDDYNEPCPTTSAGAPDVVYAYTPTSDVTVNIELCNGSAFDTRLYVFEDTCDTGTSIACNETTCGSPNYPWGVSAVYDVTLSADSTYYIVIDGDSGEAGDYVIDVTEGGYFHGQAHAQLTEINLVGVHDLGFTGKNVVIGMLDSGFARRHVAFNDPLHPVKVIAEWDFVDNDPFTELEADEPLYHGVHGGEGLGILGAYVAGEYVGGAYDASFILCGTEDLEAEYRGEEDNYVAALEFIEAHGGDMSTASIGYLTFDDPWDSYTQEDLDGLTAVCTIGVNIATANGMHCLTGAGNEGHDDDPTTSHLLVPSDAFELIAVGSVYSDGSIASPSSDGPTADGRVKPEIVARGKNTRTVDYYLEPDVGYIGRGGTSYSTPLTACAVACLIDAYPDWSVQKMREALFTTADYYVANGTFDPLYIRGYGIIDTLAALRADCNDNDIDDLVDVSGGGSLDCNANDIPDECEEDCDGDGIPDDCETFTDCNANGRPDECDLDCDSDGIPDDCETEVAEQDCDADGICNGPHIATCPVDDLFCADCNANGIPDACDIRAPTSSDADADHLPDECSFPPAQASSPHDTRKNRYISVNPNTNGFNFLAMQISLSSMLRCSGDLRAACSQDSDCEPGTSPCAEHPSAGTVLGWIGTPWDASCYGEDGTPNGNPCTGQYVSRVVHEPVFRRWILEDVVHISDCEIVPVATYDLRLTKNEIIFSDPLPVGTILKAAPWHYGDTVGVGTGDLPPLLGFTPPNQIVNVNDVTAYLLTAKGDTTPSAHTTWVDLHGLGDGAPPNYILNVSDLQRILFGLEGKRYSDSADQLDPAGCP
ncbi:MAG: S8 family serine peptidase [Phycisphaerales bacterium]|nr:MAG: S8 family serine peptidase [Phycisphaerales bacterium]